MESKNLLGDALQLFKSIPDRSINLVVTDPPYGILYKDWDRIDFIGSTTKWVEQSFR